jgi:lipoprotein-releasing system ATP-binding protein
MSEVLACQNLKRTFKDGQNILRVLEDVNLSVCKGDIIGISGSSGSGKTTLLNILGLLDVPTQGNVTYSDKEVTSLGSRAKARIRNRQVGFIFQEFFLIKEFSVRENVMIPALNTLHVWEWFPRKKEFRQRADRILEDVGLKGREKSDIRNLSGGEKQRVAIARALINEPDVIFCDEPTGNLDEDTEEGIKSLFRDLNENKQTTIVIVSHNNSLLEICKKRFHLTHGKLETV